ncbi:RNA12 protein-domain-containing protein [Mrakia frigida]|uniref:Yme2p n=1 Tax=Mrakia frigida TaxID=29902 RepID=UPI003FCC192C
MIRPFLRTSSLVSLPSRTPFRPSSFPLPLLRPSPLSVRPTTRLFPSRRFYADEAVEDARGPPLEEPEPAKKAEDFGGDQEKEIVLPPPLEAQFFVSSIFPIQLGKLDPRPKLALLRKDDLLDQFSLICSDIPVHSFKHVKTVKQAKDGGVFVRFTYVPLPEEEGGSEKALTDVEKAFNDAATKLGGLKTWSWLGAGKIWRVLGRPWHEDLNRFPSSQLRIQFDGPDVNQETLYDLLRPYGHLSSITPPAPQPALTPRFALVNFTRLHSSTAAVSCLHGLSVPPTPPRVVTVSKDPSVASPLPNPPSNSPSTLTRMSFSYVSPLKAHVVRDWISGHPKIALPLLAFLIGTLSYTFFDPIREFMVSSKILGRFNIEGYTLIKYLKSLGATILPSFFDDPEPPAPAPKSGETETDAWRERNEAEKIMENWMHEYPTGFIVLTGPHGSGKTALAQKIIDNERKKYLIIDCAAISKAKTDAAMIAELANQTGYWPMFGFLTSMNSLIDLASMGLIGQKAGFSTDFPTQLKQILDVVSASLKHVSEHELEGQKKLVQTNANRVVVEAEEVAFSERLKRIGYHDPRMDDVAGNGLISEVGYGDERTTPADLASPNDAVFLSSTKSSHETSTEISSLDKDRDTIAVLPVIVLKNFAIKGSKKDELWNTIAEWSASLIENQIAQVVVVGDNTSASKPLAKALPSKPLNAISLTDADHKTSLEYVSSKLGSARTEMTGEEKEKLRTLGGRMTDLDELLVKLRSGLTIPDAVEDILTRTQVELRKSVFGDDAEEAKNLPWSRAQAWKIVKDLSSKGELSYSALLLAFPFKGAEDKLKNLEAAEFVSITYINGRPSLVKPGKPLYHAAFKKLVEDPVFRASQTIAFNAEVIAASENEIKSAETELLSLKDIGFETGAGWKLLSGASGIEMRAGYLLEKLKVAQTKVNTLEKENEATKAVLSSNA